MKVLIFMCVFLFLAGEVQSRDRRNDRRLSPRRNLRGGHYYACYKPGNTCNKFNSDGTINRIESACTACTYLANDGVACKD